MDTVAVSNCTIAFQVPNLATSFRQARAADEAGIQFRMLNASKGPAVRGPRAQMDRSVYKAAMQRLLGAQPGLEIHDGAVTDLLLQQAGSSAGQQAAVAGVLLASGEAQLSRCEVQTLLMSNLRVLSLSPERCRAKVRVYYLAITGTRCTHFEMQRRQ